MFIGCENSSGWNDYYFIEGVESLEELQSYVQNKMPVLGRKVDRKLKRTIAIEEDSITSLIYLNNYYNIFLATLYFMSKKEHKKLEEEKCITCLKFGSFGCQSKFNPDDLKMCGNYKEPVTKIRKSWIKFWNSN